MRWKRLQNGAGHEKSNGRNDPVGEGLRFETGSEDTDTTDCEKHISMWFQLRP